MQLCYLILIYYEITWNINQTRSLNVNEEKLYNIFIETQV